jgi:PAS domain S-box-containing protein
LTNGDAVQTEAGHPADLVRSLPPLPESVQAARRLVRANLESLEIDEDLVDTAGLLVSELVTNAVLHARTDIGLAVQVRSAVLRVEVSDASARVPSPRHYAPTAATGRGLALVEALSDEFGMRVTDVGKIVWFTLSLDLAQPAGTDLTGAPTFAESTVVESADVEAATAAVAGLAVLFARVPIALYEAFAQQAEGLLREYLLSAYGNPDDLAAAERLGVAAQALGRVTDAVGDVIADQVATSPSADVTAIIPASEVRAFAELHAVLVEAVTLADTGALLAPPSQPEIVALGDWFCAQVDGQARGLPAEPWTRPPTGRPPARPRTDWDPAPVLTARTAMVAADDANRILAISPPVTGLLGWTADDLVGHRIVTVIPEELREAHIAGFTRYLTTGQARILGRRVPVPALHKDGRHVAITVLVREQRLPGGGRVFIAELRAAGPDRG